LDDGALRVGPQEVEQPRAGDAPDDEAESDHGEEDASYKTLSP